MKTKPAKRAKRAPIPREVGPNPTMVPVAEVRKLDPSWPWGLDQTYSLIRTGKLGAVKVGRRYFLRAQDLAAFITAHAATVAA